MGAYPLHTIKTVVHGEWLQEKHPDAIITNLYTDSRRIVQAEGSLFFALETNHRDGHSFIRMAYERGVRHFIVHKKTDLSIFQDANFILVKDTLSALQLLAAYHRSQFQETSNNKALPVIGITGSNGKTIVKEWLYQLLHQKYTIVRSPKSYNSAIGVPLSIWQIEQKHTLALFEAGISEKGEMDILEKMIQPNISILTSIGDAHREGFKDLQEKLEEKAMLFRSSDTVIIPYSIYKQLPSLTNKICICWGEEEASNLRILNKKETNGTTTLFLSWNGDLFDIHLPFQDEASLQNALTCCCTCLHLGVPKEELAMLASQLKPVRLRLEIKRGQQHSTIINDSYSADLTSFDIAFSLLNQQRQHKRKTVILSDLVLPKEETASAYEHLSKMIRTYGVQKVIAVGSEAPAYLSQLLPKEIELLCYDDTTHLLDHIYSLSFSGEAVLIKGARTFELEKLIPFLEQQIHETVLEVNMNAFLQNMKKIRGLLKPGVKTMAVVKAFGYGTGSYEIANLLQEQGIDYLTVAFADEGVALRKAGITVPIMVMNAEPGSFEVLTNHLLEPELYSFSILDAFLQHLDKEGFTQYPVHIKIDTGMHRLGFEKHEWQAMSEKLKADLIHVRSVFSHLAAAEDRLEDDFTQQQAQAFDQACEIIRKNISTDFLRHLSNSSGIIRHPHLQYDMVRAGIALYGFAGGGIALQLDEVMSLRTTIAQIKKLMPGDTVGYNRKGKITRPTVIATIRVGYADGYPRQLSNGKGKMLVHGKEVPVIGNVCMDMTMLDITDVPGVKEGDKVVVFGKDRSLSMLASEANTIPYEIMTGISQRVKRVYIEE